MQQPVTSTAANLMALNVPRNSHENWTTFNVTEKILQFCRIGHSLLPNFLSLILLLFYICSWQVDISFRFGSAITLFLLLCSYPYNSDQQNSAFIKIVLLTCYYFRDALQGMLLVARARFTYRCRRRVWRHLKKPYTNLWITRNVNIKYFL